MAGELDGQVALVTGGASGIGAACCRALAAAGAAVAVADVQEQAGAEVARAIGGDAMFVALDVADEAAWRRALDAVLARWGRLDVLVNNAGISGGPGTIETTTLEQWERVHAVDSDGVFLGCKAAIEGMRRTSPAKPAPGGSIVNVSSIAGVVGAAGPLAYTAAKGAVRLLSKSVAMHCADKGLGIRCNSVHPGGVDTPIFEPLWQMVGREQGRRFIGERHPIGRMAAPAELAEVVLFLAGPRSGFVTGAEIVADGGVTATILRSSILAPR